MSRSVKINWDRPFQRGTSREPRPNVQQVSLIHHHFFAWGKRQWEGAPIHAKSNLVARPIGTTAVSTTTRAWFDGFIFQNDVFCPMRVRTPFKYHMTRCRGGYRVVLLLRHDGSILDLRGPLAGSVIEPLRARAEQNAQMLDTGDLPELLVVGDP